MNSTSSPSNGNRKTLGLSGVTLHAMTLVTPGAFVWFLLPVQILAAFQGSYSDIWPGVLAALLLALVTVAGLSDLVNRYPLAGTRSAYHFAQSVFEEKSTEKNRPGARLVKFLTGWSAHLFYWVYPGVLIGFLTTLFDYLARQFGYSPTLFGQILLACAFSAFVGFLALRGITGSTSSSMVLNILQVSALVILSVLALVYRALNPDNIPLSGWQFPSIVNIFIPATTSGLLLQTAIAFFLFAGFETTAAMGIYAPTSGKDLSRGTVLGLLVQGVVSYLFQYLAIGLVLNTPLLSSFQRASAGALFVPLGDLSIKIGNSLLAANGFALMLVIAATVVISTLAASLTALNNGVRVNFAMALDAEMPGILGALHPRFSTPYISVVLLSILSALIASAGVLGGLPVLLGLVLASNLGAFLLYALICALAILPTPYHMPSLQRSIPAFLAVLANLGMAVLLIGVGLQMGGTVSYSVWLALGLAFFWFIFDLFLFLLPRKARSTQS